VLEFLNTKPLKVNYKQKPSDELFETIRIENGNISNLAYHQARVFFAFRNYYKSKALFSLKELLQDIPKNGLYRAKVVYNKSGVLSINFYPYQAKKIKRVMLIENNLFEYRFKYLNREFFDYLHQNFEADEFIITQYGYIKEFTIGNIAFFENSKKKWITPAKPFLLGTTLQALKKNSTFNLSLKNINYKDLQKYSKIAILNAMLKFRIL